MRTVRWMAWFRRWRAFQRAQWHRYVDDDGAYWWRREKNGVWQFKRMDAEDEALERACDRAW
jgi:hypothetical protein